MDKKETCVNGMMGDGALEMGVANCREEVEEGVEPVREQV